MPPLEGTPLRGVWPIESVRFLWWVKWRAAKETTESTEMPFGGRFVWAE